MDKKTLAYAFHGTPAQLERLKDIIAKTVEIGPIKIDLGGPVERWDQLGGWVNDLQNKWPQAGGWFLDLHGDPIKVSQPDDSLANVTRSVYTALSAAKQRE
jgi:hypothetical protein